DLREQPEPAVLRQRVQEVRGVLVERSAADVRDQARKLGRRDARVEQQTLHALVRDDRRRIREELGPARKRALLARVSERGAGLGSGDRDLFGHDGSSRNGSAALDLERQLLEEIRVRLRVDLATEQLAGAGDRERRDLLAELLTGAPGFQ